MGCYALVFLTSHSKVKYFPSVLKLFSSARSWGEVLGRDMGLKHCFILFYFETNPGMYFSILSM